MEFTQIPAEYSPAYAWLWNTTVTREEVARQIDEMYDAGIRAFYVIGEPENFRPNRRRTYLKPEYLSDGYIELLMFAADYAKQKGMYTWLYNEGGFPSGMVCGKIVAENPALYLKHLQRDRLSLKAGEPLKLPDGAFSAFVGTQRVADGYTPAADTAVDVYSAVPIVSIQSDIADARNIEPFLRMTHERLYSRFGERMGRDIVYMFDDEAHMNSWTEGLDGLFREKYGYEIADWLPWIAGVEKITTKEQAKARIDYEMLCGELVRNRYFLPMKRWLNAHGMKSVGHLDRDNESDGFMNLHYGSVMEMLRAFDVPGIDVIWSQISFPIDGRPCSESSQFFPRIASSAARQIGSRQCLSESFAVFGAHVTPDEMRYGVNFQAVMGINLFNFMMISYDRKSVRSLQFRPNFIGENPGMDMLGQINMYTARLSYVMQNSTADITTALYYPIRSICAGGDYAVRAKAAFEALGNRLDAAGVCFDVIDEAYVRAARREGNALVGEHTAYTEIFVPDADFEPEDVLEKLAGFSSAVKPCVETACRSLRARKQIAPDGVYYFLCNIGGERVTADVAFAEQGAYRLLDLETGALYDGGSGRLTLTLERGEGRMVFFPQEKDAAVPRLPVCEKLGTLDGFEARITRRYVLDEQGPRNEKTDLPLAASGEWEQGFSGEVTYTAAVDFDLPDAPIAAELGEVRHFARLFVNGEKRAEATMPPYRVRLGSLKRGDRVTVVVANTIANTCAGNIFFTSQDIRDVGPYNENMQKHEAKALPGGWSGALTLYALKE